MPNETALQAGPQDDFGLAINSAVRMYRRNNSEQTLDILVLYSHKLMKYIDSRTLWVAIQDLQPDCVEAFDEEIPEGQIERFTELRDTLIKEYFRREREERCLDAQIKARNMGIISSDWRKGCFDSEEAFINWYQGNVIGQAPAGYTDVASVPLDAECAGYFGELLYLNIAYSVGRQTYMPYASASFAMANREAIDRELAGRIWKLIKNETDSSWARLQVYISQIIKEEEK